MIYEVRMKALDGIDYFSVIVEQPDMGSTKENMDSAIIAAELEYPKCQVTHVTLREDIAMLLKT
jgi:hypothetical protein